LIKINCFLFGDFKEKSYICNRFKNNLKIMSKKYVKVPVKVLEKLALICDVAEFSENQSLAKIAREVRPMVKDLEYV
jgi:hypothetical protein